MLLNKNDREKENVKFLNDLKKLQSKKCIDGISKEEDMLKFIKDFCTNIGILMKINIESMITIKDGILLVRLKTNRKSVIIGKYGRTLDAIQLLLKQTIKNKFNINVKIDLDIENYRKNKLNKIKKQVVKIIEDVQSSQIDAILDPMNSYERRAVHLIASEYDNIKTVSVGRESNRHIIIKYIEREI